MEESIEASQILDLDVAEIEAQARETVEPIEIAAFVKITIKPDDVVAMLAQHGCEDRSDIATMPGEQYLQGNILS